MQQLLINGFQAGLLYALLGISFQIIFIPTRFFHLAHAGVMVMGGYLGYFVLAWLGEAHCDLVSYILGLAVASVGGGTSGWILNRFIFVKMREQNASSEIKLLASLGLLTIMVHFTALVAGEETQVFNFSNQVIVLSELRVSTIQLASMCLALVLCALVSLAFYKSFWGTSLRSIGENLELARVYGVDAQRVISMAFVFGSALAGLVGFLYSSDFGLRPGMGLQPLMVAVVGVLVGGGKGLIRPFFGCVFLGLGRQIVSYIVGPEWQDPITFAILVLALLAQSQNS